MSKQKFLKQHQIKKNLALANEGSEAIKIQPISP